MENSILLNASYSNGLSIYATEKNADLLTGVVAGCLIVLTIVVAVKILK